MSAAKPSLELLRELSDEHVLQALLDAPRLTRAELAARTGISKPTVGESVRRLVEAGVVVDTGERTTGRGRVGTYFALAPDVGTALVASIAPEGITAELVDARGAVLAAATAPVGRPARPSDVTAALLEVCARVQRGAPGPTRLAVISAADPVDRATGRLVHLPDAPFLLGELSPVEALAGLVDGPVRVDNDVNWAARAERAASGADGSPPPGDSLFLHLGEGLGAAVTSDGEVRRGHRGLAGEIAHVVTAGPDGRALPFTEVFARLDLRRAGSTAVDLDALLRSVAGTGTRAVRTRTALARAVAGVVAAAVALTDPAEVVVGGRWGGEPVVFDAIVDQCNDLARSPVLRRAVGGADAPLAGARADAVARLRRLVTGYRTTLGQKPQLQPSRP